MSILSKDERLYDPFIELTEKGVGQIESNQFHLRKGENWIDAKDLGMRILFAISSVEPLQYMLTWMLSINSVSKWWKKPTLLQPLSWDELSSNTP